MEFEELQNTDCRVEIEVSLKKAQGLLRDGHILYSKELHSRIIPA